MEGFELAATLVATSDFPNFFCGPRRAPGDSSGRGKRSVFAPSMCARLAAQDPFIFYKGLCRSEASYTVNMRRLGPSHGTVKN